MTNSPNNPAILNALNSGGIENPIIAAIIRELGDYYDRAENATPIGAIFPFDALTLPDGYLILNGSRFDKTIYPDLFNHLGTDQLKDYRDRVLRGAGNLIALGEIQEDALQNITGEWPGIYNELNLTGTGCFSKTKSGSGWIDFPFQSNGADCDTPTLTFDASGSVRTADETHVKAIGVNFIIKAK